MPTIAIDFDHTICDSANITPPFKIGPPMEGAVETLTKLKKAGYTIIVHTCRANDGAKAVRVVEDWMKYFKVPFDAVWQHHNGVKPVADVYLDDKGMHFDSWGRVQEELGL